MVDVLKTHAGAVLTDWMVEALTSHRGTASVATTSPEATLPLDFRGSRDCCGFRVPQEHFGFGSCGLRNSTTHSAAAACAAGLRLRRLRLRDRSSASVAAASAAGFGLARLRLPRPASASAAAASGAACLRPPGPVAAASAAGLPLRQLRLSRPIFGLDGCGFRGMSSSLAI